MELFNDICLLGIIIILLIIVIKNKQRIFYLEEMNTILTYHIYKIYIRDDLKEEKSKQKD